jgi:hypothetical protein
VDLAGAARRPDPAAGGRAVVTGADPTAALCLLAAMVPPVVEDRPPGEDVSRVVGLLRPR